MFYQLSKDIAHKQTLMITINRMIKDKYDTSEITEIYLDLISKVIESLIEDDEKSSETDDIVSDREFIVR
jgi:hypothetical protein